MRLKFNLFISIITLISFLLTLPALAQKGLSGLKEFTSSGTLLIPSNVDNIMVEMWGLGGGGGGGGSSTGTVVGGGGGGGGGGAYVRAVIPVPPGQSVRVNIGLGGKGGDPDQN